jgi:hypothetical protein
MIFGRRGAMRRELIIIALLANALISGLVLLLLLNGGGWGDATRLSATEAELLIVVAAAAFVLNLLLVPVLGLSFWARDRSFRRQEAELETRRHPPATDAGPDPISDQTPPAEPR